MGFRFLWKAARYDEFKKTKQGDSYIIGPPRLKGKLTMKSSTRQTIVCLVLILCTPLYTHSHTSFVRKGLAIISGKFTIKGKAAPGIVVGLRATDYSGARS